MNISEAVYCQKDKIISLNGLFHKMSIFNQDSTMQQKGYGSVGPVLKIPIARSPEATWL